ncbi:methyl-accepting chemotaxis protein [Asticcacaulis sp. 201]|uniref:methyl-accepting chemotaxis protein n=1 Tax=Asticcacaulis sp. 201 TaxID=3028787 RepID=UPI002916C476|nr:methyl-accepting chemotaxis protein [Asticcacaulis sp. 201]MDV6330942.1 methyl-accepting chemotaxis protein [Asticcacaulis sp. 201]
MNYKNWPILAKSLSLLVALGMVSIAATVFATNNMRNIDTRYSAVLTGPEVAILNAARANRGVIAVSRDIFRLALVTDPQAIAEADKTFSASRDLTLGKLDAAAKAAPQEADQVAAIKHDFETALSGACAETLRLAHSTDPNDSVKAARGMLDICEPALSRVSAKITAFNDGLTASLGKLAAATTAQTHSTIWLTYASVVGGLLAVMAVAFWLTLSGIVKPVRGLTDMMTGMARGQLSVSIPGQDRKDELGEMSRTVEIFRKGLTDAETMRGQAAEQKERSEAERKAATLKLADDFEKSVGGIVTLVSSAATEMQAAAAQLTATAQESSAQSVAVSAAAEEAGANVTSVASSAEELGASVAEIGRQVETSAAISSEAVREADEAVRIVAELDGVASSIGGVVDLIAGLAGQTNLLALNATIESARAGEAGKGFAVVASEVKALAAQTAKATTDISDKITQIQAATSKASSAIQNITGTIQNISRTSTMIASAVEQQSAATREIVQAVNQASIGTQEVTSNITGVAQASEQTGEAASQVLSSSAELATQAERLHVEMDKFLATVRAA